MMRSFKLMFSNVLLVTIASVGCLPTPADNSGKSTPTTTTETEKKDDHGHEHGPGEHAHMHGAGPNGGVVFDLGKYHAEFTVDHPGKSCSVLFIDGEDEKAKEMPVSANELILTTKESKTAEGKVVPPMTITLLPQDTANGKAAKFTGTDPSLELVADHQGTIIGEVDGKPAQGEFKEE